MTTQTAERRISEIVGNFSSSSVMVIGDVMIDEYMWGEVKRISPEAPVPVVDVESVSRKLGGAANVIQNLRKLNVKPFLISIYGSDDNGRLLRKMIDELDCSSDGLLESAERPTTIKTRIIARNQQVVRADREVTTNLSAKEYEGVWNLFIKNVDSVRGVIISDYGKGVISQPVIGKIIETCVSKNMFIAIDPKERHFDLYKGVSVITPNLKEAHTMLGLSSSHNSSDEDIQAIGWKLVEQLSLPYLLITLSERGMGLFQREGKVYSHLPTAARKVFDVTGAGDTVISVFSAAVVSGATPLEAAFLANRAAGITVGQLGTASVNQEELIADCLKMQNA
ncbi:MAG: D-glycero-beta-D-manno-heptose-7-phosphate kinase [Chitinispirillales bacterium]|jgi:D-beta-D-heptose 7-phosphate kinase/D-beta-D-heptose 1-phosphate adenosyltransferase|nr:D-glycero-beta-D-manno-heptose-7-phosphate kinase [Chitinispirillales bacterium]